MFSIVAITSILFLLVMMNSPLNESHILAAFCCKFALRLNLAEAESIICCSSLTHFYLSSLCCLVSSIFSDNWTNDGIVFSFVVFEFFLSGSLIVFFGLVILVKDISEMVEGKFELRGGILVGVVALLVVRRQVNLCKLSED